MLSSLPKFYLSDVKTLVIHKSLRSDVFSNISSFDPNCVFIHTEGSTYSWAWWANSSCRSRETSGALGTNNDT